MSKAIKVALCVLTPVVAILSGCNTAITKTEIFRAKSFCIVSENVQGTLVENNDVDFSVYKVILDGKPFIIYEGNGVEVLTSGSVIKSKAGWTWTYETDPSGVIIQHLTGLEKPSEVEVNLNHMDWRVENIMYVANSIFPINNPKCSA